MNIWILTIGSSDIQLKPSNNWTNLFRTGRSQLKPNRGFSPAKLLDTDLLRVPARVMGVIYSQPQAEVDDLAFPLIDNFISKIQAQTIDIDRVILILSDQSVFSEEKRTQNHPYWQDTCTLQPILEKYVRQELKDSSPDLQFQLLLLKPTSTVEGLDDWNAVLKLVHVQFAPPNLEFPDDATIYVSHQAGTPAISSAVQFCSLAKFGNHVKFLVSNEYNPTLPEKPLEGSSYLRGIRMQEAKALLGSHNYAGVEALIRDYIKENENVKTLLKTAMNWNFAKFNDFLESLSHHPNFASDVEERASTENWWWIAYEEVYLAVIRKEQGNIVESFFHSFRAFEGIFAEWGKKKFGRYIETDNGVPCLQHLILEDAKDYFSNFSGDRKKAVANIKSKLESLKIKNDEPNAKTERDDRVELNFSTLCKLFKAFQYSDYKNCPELKIFWDDNKEKNVSEKRNSVVHQVQGMSELDLWNFWGVSSPEEWEARLLKFLNVIAMENLPEGFKTLEGASLMAKVHEELKRAIAAL